MSERTNTTTQRFDNRWYELELEKLIEKWDDDFLKRSWELPDEAWPGSSSRLSRIVNLGVEMTREIAKAVDGVCREIWQKRGGAEDENFINIELHPRVVEAVNNRGLTLQKTLASWHPFYDLRDLDNARESIRIEIEALLYALDRENEIEIRKMSSPTVETTAAKNADTTPKRTNRGGRPREDKKRERVKILKQEGKSWPQIATIVSAETGEPTTGEACRKLASENQEEQSNS